MRNLTAKITIGLIIFGLMIFIVFKFIDLPVEYKTYTKPPGDIVCFQSFGHHPLLLDKNKLTLYGSLLLENVIGTTSLNGDVLRLRCQKYDIYDSLNYVGEARHVMAISRHDGKKYLNYSRIESKGFSFGDDHESKLLNVFCVPTSADDIIGVINKNEQSIIVTINESQNTLSLYNLKGEFLDDVTINKDIVFDLFIDIHDDRKFKLYGFDGLNISVYNYKNHNLNIELTIPVKNSYSKPQKVNSPGYEKVYSFYAIVVSGDVMYSIDFSDMIVLSSKEIKNPVYSPDSFFLISNGRLFYNYINTDRLKLIKMGSFRFIGWDNVSPPYSRSMNVHVDDNKVYAYSDLGSGDYYIFNFNTSRIKSGYYYYESKILSNLNIGGLYLYTDRDIYYINQDELDKHADYLNLEDSKVENPTTFLLMLLQIALLIFVLSQTSLLLLKDTHRSS